MKSSSFLFSALLIISCTQKAPNKKEAILKFSRDTVLIGKVIKGDTASINVSVYNLGSDTLKVTNIGYGCGCTSGKLDKNFIPPKDSAHFSLVYNSKDDLGQVSKTVLLENNSKEIFKALSLNAEVINK